MRNYHDTYLTELQINVHGLFVMHEANAQLKSHNAFLPNLRNLQRSNTVSFSENYNSICTCSLGKLKVKLL